MKKYLTLQYSWYKRKVERARKKKMEERKRGRALGYISLRERIDRI